MNAPARLILVLGCLVLAAIELPQGTELVVDDLDGPYGAHAVLAAPVTFGRSSIAPDAAGSFVSGRSAASHATSPWNRDAANRDEWDEVSTLGDEPQVRDNEERIDDDRGDATFSFDAHLAGN